MQAEQDDMEMELEMGTTDIWAYEPVDERLRPIRLNYQLFKDRKNP